MAVDEDTQYEYISNVVDKKLEYTRDALKLYIQSFTLIVGGSIWLNTQIPQNSTSRGQYTALSNVIVILLLWVTGVVVFEALRSWYRFRQKMAEFDATPYKIPKPSRPWWGAETAMLLGMICSTILFLLYNPFSL
ncbi:hypothetical protein [Mesorhizobium sp. M0496]|uniref:hypothetical protein n=1 Tax=Mesorhizobium sp. M0496 TaxID=2956952 RepID=UPI00333DA5D3